MACVVVAGQDVFEAREERKRTALGIRPLFNTALDDNRLCNWQVEESRKGVVEAEIVRSMYGFSVRYASGLQDFALLAGARMRTVDGTLADAIRWAKNWQAQCSNNRFVTMPEEYQSEL